MTIVHPETGGLLVGGTASEIGKHIKATWERGRAAITLLRKELGPDADALCPLRKGGAEFLKNESVMHDTCNCANLVASREVAFLKEESGLRFFGRETWKKKSDDETKMTDNLCGNHTRGLPIDAANRLFEKWLSQDLGNDFLKAASNVGGRNRLEKSGPALLRSIAKLVHRGFGAYAKGDGKQMGVWLAKEHPHLLGISVGRAEISKRQDWSLEVSEAIYPLIPAILEYLIPLEVLGPNVLRDSIRQRLELRHFEAYIHVSAILWVVCFNELRAVTNGNNFDLSPPQLHDYYEDLWNVGAMLRTSTPLRILDPDYRPFKRPDVGCAKAVAAYAAMDRRFHLRREALLAYRKKTDLEPYLTVLVKVLNLFGEGIHESLSRTMGDYLEATGGGKTNASLTDFQRARSKKLKCHNNNAERPFAVIKQLWKLFPSMRLHMLTYLASARVNGTFREGGAYKACTPKLKKALHKLCCIRDKTPGAITLMVREHRAADKKKADVHTLEVEKAKQEENERILRARASKKNAAFEADISPTLAIFNLRLRGKKTKKATLEFLKMEFSSRVGRWGNEYPMDVVGHEYRCKNRDANGDQKLKMTSTAPDVRDQPEYLADLCRLMVQYDSSRYCVDVETSVGAVEMRKLGVISERNTSALSTRIKNEHETRLYEATRPKDSS